MQKQNPAFHDADRNETLTPDEITSELSHLTVKEIQYGLDEYVAALSEAIQSTINHPSSDAAWSQVRAVYEKALWYAAAQRAAQRKWGKDFWLSEGPAPDPQPFFSGFYSVVNG